MSSYITHVKSSLTGIKERKQHLEESKSVANNYIGNKCKIKFKDNL